MFLILGSRTNRAVITITLSQRPIFHFFPLLLLKFSIWKGILMLGVRSAGDEFEQDGFSQHTGYSFFFHYFYLLKSLRVRMQWLFKVMVWGWVWCPIVNSVAFASYPIWFGLTHIDTVYGGIRRHILYSQPADLLRRSNCPLTDFYLKREWKNVLVIRTFFFSALRHFPFIWLQLAALECELLIHIH